MNFLVIDGNSILNRAFYGIRLLTNKEGFPTNAIYGFLNIMLKQIETYKPEYICVAFDLKEKTFRHIEYPEYKAQRKGMPDELFVQMPVLKKILNAMNIKILETPGFEADDIIGTVSKMCDDNKINCIILTGDKDDLQLASDNTQIDLIITKMGKTFTTTYKASDVLDKYGLTPTEFIDLKAIMGDKSDNIPGVAGIGEVGATELITKYKSIENIYNHLDELDIKSGLKTKLANGKDAAFLSKHLATIVRNVDIDADFEHYKYSEYNNEELSKILKELELKTIAERLIAKTEKTICANLSDVSINELINISKDVGKVYYCFFKNPDYLCCGICTNEQNILFLENSEALKALKTVFEDENITIVGNNIKDDIVYLASKNITFNGKLFDTAIGVYVLNPSKNSYNTDVLAYDYTGLSLVPYNDFISKTGEVTISDNLKNYVASYLVATIKLEEEIKKQIIKNEQTYLLYDIELPLVNVLAQMEINGFTVNKHRLEEFSNMLRNRIDILINKIYTFAGHEFNINSPKQLGTVLFEELNLPVVKKKKSGYSTEADVLEKLQDKHEIIGNILEYRKLAKLKSTYADGLQNAVVNGKIHTNFKQTVTQTGRLSSTEPNLQNIPARDELGLEIRKMFVPEDDSSVILSADYSQIELRVLAHIAKDQNMIDAFNHNSDIHTITASQVFRIPPHEVTPLLRSRAKAVNFGIVYGISDFSLAQDLKIKKSEAKQYIENYLEVYSGIGAYMKEIIAKARVDGYVKTLCNRVRYLPELSASNFIVRGLGERMALNTPIQGTAADIIKIAMINVFNELKNKKLNSKLILQVHDELIIETKKEELEEVIEIVRAQMELAMKLSVNLSCSINYGNSWYEAK